MHIPFERRMKRFAADDRGAVAIEYALIVALVVSLMLIGLTGLGTEVQTMYGKLVAHVIAALNP